MKKKVIGMSFECPTCQQRPSEHQSTKARTQVTSGESSQTGSSVIDELAQANARVTYREKKQSQAELAKQSFLDSRANDGTHRKDILRGPSIERPAGAKSNQRSAGATQESVPRNEGGSVSAVNGVNQREHVERKAAEKEAAKKDAEGKAEARVRRQAEREAAKQEAAKKEAAKKEEELVQREADRVARREEDREAAKKKEATKEAERKAQAKAEQKAQREAGMKAAKEEAAKKEAELAERKAQERAAHKAKREADRNAVKEEAARKKAELAEQEIEAKATRKLRMQADREAFKEATAREEAEQEGGDMRGAKTTAEKARSRDLNGDRGNGIGREGRGEFQSRTPHKQSVEDKDGGKSEMTARQKLRRDARMLDTSN